ncbi:hypothetical protein X793_00415 [Dehalococcoides mccartyi CG4]|uniref:hypothetical protein n=1 Tax=Dehalococcoides mccartyi TaxID=61435 RepID=UPI0004E039D3|nr:hypothetical protein [Dehalococcoides mccartyi]AII60153.1 hypothetical protein X793_00415 [Dehalococcoides mccartyi CG4]
MSIEPSKEDKKAIEIARKFNIRLGTLKCTVFALFEQGYFCHEVKFILNNSIGNPYDEIIYKKNTIKTYYSEWESKKQKMH